MRSFIIVLAYATCISYIMVYAYVCWYYIFLFFIRGQRMVHADGVQCLECKGCFVRETRGMTPEQRAKERKILDEEAAETGCANSWLDGPMVEYLHSRVSRRSCARQAGEDDHN